MGTKEIKGGLSGSFGPYLARRSTPPGVLGSGPVFYNGGKDLGELFFWSPSGDTHHPAKQTEIYISLSEKAGT